MDTVLSFAEAMRVIADEAGNVHADADETLPLLAAHRRVLSREIRADRDQPPFARATRDGFAVVAGGDSLKRTVIGTVRAGEQWAGAPLGMGQAVEIMTGAPLPAGSDAVVMVEHVRQTEADVDVDAERRPVAGQNIVPRGSELRAGEVALPAGTVLQASAIAIAAALGAATVQVWRRPRVAILATGDELVEVGDEPLLEQIRNSNSYTLAALVSETGGEPVRLPIVRDRAEALAEALVEARKADLILFSGGVSMGKYDLVEGALAVAHATFRFTGVRMQPGRPVVFGSLPAAASGEKPVLFFGLPGNPISTQVTFLCFVAPLLRAMCGAVELGPTYAQAPLTERVEARPGLTRLLPARLDQEAGRPGVRLIPWQGSGDLAANARANCYALLPADHEADFEVGEPVSMLLR